MVLGDGATTTLNITGTTDLAGTTTIYWPYAGDPGRITLAPTGTLSKSGTNTATVDVPLTGTGTVHSTNGTLRLTAAGAQPWAGTLRATDPGQLILNDPDWALATGANLDNITVQNNLALTGNATATSTELNSATITGPGTLALAGTSQITNTFIRDNATLRVATGATLNLPDTVIYLGPDGTIDIAGDLRLTGTPTIYWPYAGQPGRINLTPTGTLTKTDPTNATINVPVHTTVGSTVVAEDGVLTLSSAPTEVLAGSFVGRTGGTVRLASSQTPFRLGPDTELSGVSLLNLIELVGRVTVDRVGVQGATVGGDGTLVVADRLDLASGSLQGTGTTVVAPGATALVSSTSLRDGHSLVVLGAAAIQGTVLVDDGASLDLRGTATIADDAQVYGDGLVLVSGLLHKATGSGPAYVSALLENDGEVRASQGTLVVSQPWDTGAPGHLVGGVWRTSATLQLPQIQASSAHLVLDGTAAGFGFGNEGLGALTRNNAAGIVELVNGADASPQSLTNYGRVRLSPTSVVTIQGAFRQTSTGELSAGLAPGAQGRVVAGSGATISGWLTAVPAAGYAPPAGTRQQVVQAASVTGTFARVVSPDSQPFTAAYTATDVALVAGSVAPGPTPVADPTTAVPPPGVEPPASTPTAVTEEPLVDPEPATTAAQPARLTLRELADDTFTGRVTDPGTGLGLRGHLSVWRRVDGDWLRIRTVRVRDGRYEFHLRRAPARLRVVFRDDADRWHARMVLRTH